MIIPPPVTLIELSSRIFSMYEKPQRPPLRRRFEPFRSARIHSAKWHFATLIFVEKKRQEANRKLAVCFVLKPIYRSLLFVLLVTHITDALYFPLVRPKFYKGC